MNYMWFHYRKYRGSHGWDQRAYDYFNDNFASRVAEIIAQYPDAWEEDQETVRELLYLACRTSVNRIEIVRRKSKIAGFSRNDVWFGLKAAQMAACPVSRWGMKGRWCNWLTDTPPDDDGTNAWRVAPLRRPKVAKKKVAKKKVAKK